MRRSKPRPENQPPAAPVSRWRAMVTAVAGQEHLDVVARLTLILMILYSGYLWYHQLVILFLGICGLIHKPLTRSPVFWLLLAAFYIGVRNGIDWVYSDNHDFLIGYWCLAFGCSLLLPDPNEALATNGRWLIALTFLFATLSKLISGDYLSGDMFYYLLHEDRRFSELAQSLAAFRLDPADSVLEKMKGLEPEIALEYVPALQWVSQIFTWWTLLIEGAIAAAFLWPGSDRVHLWRHGLMLAFMVTTYPPTSVVTFAWILITLSVACCPAEMKKTRFCYLLLFALLSVLAHSTLKRTAFEFIAGP